MSWVDLLTKEIDEMVILRESIKACPMTGDSSGAISTIPFIEN